MKETKPILIIAVCLVATVFGLYMQFFAQNRDYPNEEQKKGVMVENKGVMDEKEFPGQEEKQPEQQPVPEEELEAETYGDGELNVYFTGMEEIQEDDTFLPYQGYADLMVETVAFLKSQTDINLPEEKYIELKLSPGMTYKSNNLISFHCYFAEIDTDQEIEYVYDDSSMEYIDICFVKKGEWNLKWKK